MLNNNYSDQSDWLDIFFQKRTAWFLFFITLILTIFITYHLHQEHVLTFHTIVNNADIHVQEAILPIHYDESKLFGPLSLLFNVLFLTIHLAFIKNRKKLKDQQDTVNNYLNIAGVMIMILDNDKNVLLMNPRGCEIMGYSAEEIIGKNFIKEFIPKRLQQDIHSVADSLIHKEIPSVRQFKNHILTKKGEERLIKWTNTSLFNDKGNPIGILSSGEDVTAHEKDLEELNLLHTLIDGSNDMVFIVRISDGYVEYANNSSEKMLGYTIEEMRDIGIDSFRRPLKQDENFLEHLEQLKEQKSLIDYAILTRKDGSEFPIEVNARSVVYKGTDYNIAIVRDISENELYKQKMLKTTQLLKEAQSLAKLGSWQLDLITYDLEWSDEIYEIFELTSQTHTPNYDGFLNAIHPEDRELVDSIYTSSVQNHTSYNYVHRLLMSDGRIKYVREQGQTFYAQDGTPLESRGTVHDVTDQKELEISLLKYIEESAEVADRLQLATTAAGIGIWVWNLDDSSLIWDDNMFSLFELDQETYRNALNYEVWRSSCHPDDIQNAEKELMDALQFNTQFDTVFRIIVPSGKIKYIHAVSILKYNEEGKPHSMIGINRDVTAEKTIEESLTLAKEAAENSDKTKSDFLANMSHEIRTPLNGVIGLTDLVLQMDLQPLQRDYLTKSQTASKALLNILNSILDYSKIEAHKLSLESIPFTLSEILDNIKALFSYKAQEKQLAFEIHVDDTVPKQILGDPLRLQQILSNLVGNALKFTTSGYVRISISATTHQGHHKLTFDVSDSGMGISSDQQKDLFQSFSQVDTSFTRKFGGTGLGLMITKNLIELMGGTISVKSSPNHGSTFSFTLLFDQNDLEQSALSNTPFSQNEDKAFPGDRDIHILLVEDNDLNQIVASERLKQMGMTYSIANNGLEAVEMVQKEKFDAILMDLQMPIMDGLEATRQIRKLPGYEDLPIIALSAAVLQDDLKMAKEAGMNDHIAKPIDKTALQNVLAKWLND